MNLFLRLVTVSVLFVPICLELRAAALRGMESRVAEAGKVPAESAMCFRSEAHRRLFERLQGHRAAGS